MAEIKHIVYLMLENRSLDNVLGWLYDDKAPNANIPEQRPPTYDGLEEHTYYNEDKHGSRHCVTKGTDNHQDVPSFDPYERFNHVNRQVFGTCETPLKPTPGTMSGFYQDFATFGDSPKQILQSYTRHELPVINGLARYFAVSDRYFSSVPTQTNCNRAFAACGNSLGLAKGPGASETERLTAFVNNRNSSLFGKPDGQQFNQPTMWNVLADNGRDKPADWMIFNSTGTWLEVPWAEGYTYTRDLMEHLQDPKFDAHFAGVGDPDGSTDNSFFQKLRDGTLPTFSFIEPEWGLKKGVPIIGPIGINGTDYHPPSNLAPGEVFLKSIYDGLTAQPSVWENVLFIINFDEHGGTYDHVPPPWTAAAPWDNGETPPPEVKACPKPEKCPTTVDRPFEFDRFGVRVPLILVSPWVAESVVFRADGDVPYDHTSVIATILTLMGIDRSKWKLGARVANAPMFDNVLTDQRRTDIPVVHSNPNWKAVEAIDPPPNDIQRRMADTLVAHAARECGLSQDDCDVHRHHVAEAQTLSQLVVGLESVAIKIRETGQSG